MHRGKNWQGAFRNFDIGKAKLTKLNYHKEKEIMGGQTVGLSYKSATEAVNCATGGLGKLVFGGGIRFEHFTTLVLYIA